MRQARPAAHLPKPMRADQEYGTGSTMPPWPWTRAPPLCALVSLAAAVAATLVSLREVDGTIIIDWHVPVGTKMLDRVRASSPAAALPPSVRAPALFDYLRTSIGRSNSKTMASGHPGNIVVSY